MTIAVTISHLSAKMVLLLLFKMILLLPVTIIITLDLCGKKNSLKIKIGRKRKLMVYYIFIFYKSMTRVS